MKLYLFFETLKIRDKFVSEFRSDDLGTKKGASPIKKIIFSFLFLLVLLPSLAGSTFAAGKIYFQPPSVLNNVGTVKYFYNGISGDYTIKAYNTSLVSLGTSPRGNANSNGYASGGYGNINGVYFFELDSTIGHTPLRIEVYSYTTGALIYSATSGWGSMPPNINPPAPSAPVGINGTVGYQSATLTWNAPSGGIKGYYIYRDGIKVSELITTDSYTDSNLTNGKTYSYQVSAVGTYDAESVESLAVELTPVIPILSAPTGIKAIEGDQKAILSWNPSANTNEYNLKRSTTTGGPYNVITRGLTTNTYTDISAINGTTYYYVVSALNSSGEESANSTQVTATPQAPQLAVSTTPALTGQAGSSQNTLTWTASAIATGYNVKRSTTAGGPYTNLSTETGITYFADTTVAKGVTYYYVVAEVNADGEGANSNEVSIMLLNNPTLDVVIAEPKVTVGQEVITNVALKNVTNIYAEDFTVGYDQTLFDYMGFEEVSGYKVYYKTVDFKGSLRFIVASEGQQNGITGEKTFLKLKFKAKAAGTAKVDALKCRVADTEKEFDLNGTACGEDSLVIDGMTDVNRSGEYTLLDLAIDSYYYGQLASNADPVKYSANQAGDENITNDDLMYIVNQMLANKKYAPNN